MNTIRNAVLAAALVAGLAACQQHTPPPASTSPAADTHGVGDGPGDGLGDTVHRAMAEAGRKMQTENITVSETGGRKAEITPRGDLIIDGKTVAIDESQRRLLLDYRARVMDIAQAGMAVGTAGAELAGKAVTEALGSIFGGHPDEVGKRVEAQAQDIKAAARGLCDRLPAMYEAQRRVAEAVPEFAPFAKTRKDDIEHCRREVEAHDAPAPTAPPAPPAPVAPPAPTA